MTTSQRNTLLMMLMMLIAASQLPAQQVPKTAPQVITPGGCPVVIYNWWKQQGGRISCSADPTRPAILLFHGLHQDMRTWTAPSHAGYVYDYRSHPKEKKIGGKHGNGNIGIYKIGLSNLVYTNDRAGWDKNVNWFDYLVSRGFTVATWSQPGPTFAPAARSALTAFDSLLSHTKQRSAAKPPAIALLGHSRGGLLIRKVLKERATNGRVQWVATLHSPHHGSALAQVPARLIAETVDVIDCCIPAALTGDIKRELKDLVAEAFRPLTKFIGNTGQSESVSDESRELTPDGPLIRSLREGEQPIAGVKYYTFGGTNPTYFRVYTWIFDAQSALPQGNPGGVYYVWYVKPVEIGELSPMLDEARDFVDEVKPGKGDGLVTDASARLPWSNHTTTNLNHAEVLWDRPLQERVARLISEATYRVISHN